MIGKEKFDEIMGRLTEEVEKMTTAAADMEAAGKNVGARWVIDKQFDFCYGHRVWSQQLEKEFCATDDYCTKCRHLHGHQGEIHVFLEGDALKRGMVTDFKHLGWFKDFIDDHLDHKFILDLNDPWFNQIVNGEPMYTLASGTEVQITNSVSTFSSVRFKNQLNTANTDKLLVRNVYVPNTDWLVGYELIIDDLSGPEQEFFEGFFFVDFIPTSENLARWMFDAVSVKMSSLGVKVTKVTLNETPKSRAEYALV